MSTNEPNSAEQQTCARCNHHVDEHEGFWPDGWCDGTIPSALPDGLECDCFGFAIESLK